MAVTVVSQSLYGLPKKDASGAALTPVRYTVYGLAANQSPLEPIEIPRVGSLMTLYGIVYTCDSIDTPEQINDHDYYVQAYFSTDRRWEVLNPRLGDDQRNFQKSYKKVQVSAPTFEKTWELAQTASGAEFSKMKWVRKDLTIATEWEVLSINVVIKVETDEEILSVMAAADAQIGYIHIFPYNINKKWLCLPNEQRRLADKMTINYSWISDPGNGAMGLEPDDPDVLDFVYPVARDPFHVYRAVIGSDPLVRPEIKTVPLFPSFNTFSQRTRGWENLPGNPI